MYVCVRWIISVEQICDESGIISYTYTYEYLEKKFGDRFEYNSTLSVSLASRAPDVYTRCLTSVASRTIAIVGREPRRGISSATFPFQLTSSTQRIRKVVSFFFLAPSRGSGILYRSLSG